MRLHRGPLTFLPKGVLRTPRDNSPVAAAQAPNPAASTPKTAPPRNAVLPREVQARAAFGAVAATSCLFAKGAFNAAGRVLPDLPSATAEQVPPPKKVAKDAAMDLLADATFKFTGLVAQGAVQALDRNVAQPAMDALYQQLRANRSALEPITEGVKYVGSLVQGAMPEVLQPDTSVQGGLKAGVHQAVKAIRQSVEEGQQALQAKAADAAFKAVAEPAGRFARGAVNAASRQIAALDLSVKPPVLDPDHRPFMPGSFPGSENDVAAMLKAPAQIPQGAREKWAAHRAHKAEAKRNAEANETFRRGVEFASLVGEGALQVLDRKALQPATDALHRHVQAHRSALEPVKGGAEHAGAAVHAAVRFGKELLNAAQPVQPQRLPPGFIDEKVPNSMQEEPPPYRATESLATPPRMGRTDDAGKHQASPQNRSQLAPVRMPGSWVD